jgi:hypothetical protein
LLKVSVHCPKYRTNSVEQHVPAALLNTPIDRIAAVDLLDALLVSSSKS